jgi:hypothetical protein
MLADLLSILDLWILVLVIQGFATSSFITSISNTGAAQYSQTSHIKQRKTLTNFTCSKCNMPIHHKYKLSKNKAQLRALVNLQVA